MEATLARYVDAVRDICSSGYSLPAKVERIQSAARRYCSQLPLTDEQKHMPDGGYGRNLLYRDPDHGFVVISMVWPPGAGGTPHDHQTWGVVAVAEGTVRIENFQREDDGSSATVANLKRTSCLDATPGQVGHVLPPYEDIHAISNPSQARAISIHTYGRDIRRCRLFDRDSGAVEFVDLGYHTGEPDVARAGAVPHA